MGKDIMGFEKIAQNLGNNEDFVNYKNLTAPAGFGYVCK